MTNCFGSICYLCIALLNILVVEFSFGYPRLLRGRPRGKNGMVGAPIVSKKTVLPKEQWFTQRLTHFDDSNIATWQQRCVKGFSCTSVLITARKGT